MHRRKITSARNQFISSWILAFMLDSIDMGKKQKKSSSSCAFPLKSKPGQGQSWAFCLGSKVLWTYCFGGKKYLTLHVVFYSENPRLLFLYITVLHKSELSNSIQKLVQFGFKNFTPFRNQTASVCNVTVFSKQHS